MEPFEYLKTAAERGSKLGLERISAICKRLGDPQNSITAVHVAGTNGKGSFCAMLSAILADSGFTVGCFSSPALTSVCDSFRINGERISRDELGAAISGLYPICESMDDKPTEFEILTAAAFLIFKEKGCDIAVIECGMGGITDSTNVIASPILSVITNVAMDHPTFLGSTLKEIAEKKSGIIKRGRPVLYGGNCHDAYEVIAEASAKNGSPLTVTDHSRLTVTEAGISGMRVNFDSREYTSALTGTYQKYNIANVLTAVELLRSEGLDIPENAVISGLSKARIHGRFELVSADPTVIFDGAHNPDGIVQAAESIEKYFSGKVVLMIGVMADKEYGLYPELLGKFTDRAYTVRPDNPRALDSAALADVFTGFGIEAYPCETVSEGVEKAIGYAKNRNLPLIALGSLYMYEEFKTTLHNLL